MANCNSLGTDITVNSGVYYFWDYQGERVYAAATVTSLGGTGSGGQQIASLHVTPATLAAFDVSNKLHSSLGNPDTWMCSNQLTLYISHDGQGHNI